MTPEERIERLIKKINVTPRAQTHSRTLNDALEAQEKWKNEQSANLKPNIWRIIMKNKMTKFATAAAVILIAVLGITFLDKSVPSAYAFEQTVEAFESVRYMHLISSDSD